MNTPMNPLSALLDQHGLEGTFEILANDYKLVIKHAENQPFVLLDYDQLNSPRKHPVVDYCRGIIFSSDLQTVVCRPFKRFYNIGEFPEMEKNFDWSSCTVDEKADGSLIKVWFNCIADRWEIATRGSFFGEHQLPRATNPSQNLTFRELFLQTAGLTDHEFETTMRDTSPPEFTHLFELCAKENTVVIPYKEPQIVFLGSVKNACGTELVTVNEPQGSLFDTKAWVRSPVRYSASSASEVKDLANTLPGLSEGFVVCDSEGRRMKVKSTKYVVAHLSKSEGGVSPKRAVLLALGGDIPEFISYFPEYADYLNPYAEHVQECFEHIERRWAEIKQIEDKREMAMHIKDDPLKSIFFEFKKGRTLKEILDSMTENTKLSFFGNLDKPMAREVEKEI